MLRRRCTRVQDVRDNAASRPQDVVTRFEALHAADDGMTPFDSMSRVDFAIQSTTHEHSKGDAGQHNRVPGHMCKPPLSPYSKLRLPDADIAPDCTSIDHGNDSICLPTTQVAARRICQSSSSSSSSS